jgi:hypothetical protein
MDSASIQKGLAGGISQRPLSFRKPFDRQYFISLTCQNFSNTEGAKAKINHREFPCAWMSADYEFDYIFLSYADSFWSRRVG